MSKIDLEAHNEEVLKRISDDGQIVGRTPAEMLEDLVQRTSSDAYDCASIERSNRVINERLGYPSKTKAYGI